MAKIIIREILKQKGISIKELAGGMGITPSAVSQILANPNPSIQQLERIANVIGVDVMDLFAQNFSYINGYVETKDNIYPIKNREQFVSLIDKVDGIVHIPSLPREDMYKNAIIDFCNHSIKDNENNAIMMRYSISQVFTLSYDAESTHFSLTLCIGNGVIKFKIFNVEDFKSEGTFTAQGMNQLLEAILSEIEAIYNDRIIDTNNAKVRLTDFNS